MKKSVLLLAILIISINCSAQYTKLFEFGTTSTGYACKGSLISDGTFLYGMTSLGGAHNLGTIFKVKPDGSGYSTLFDFDSLAGCNPNGDLLSDGSFFYGMTSAGGTGGRGTIFKIQTDGSGYTKLLDFDGATSGSTPYGSLISDGTFLYGMTSAGGTNDAGTIIKIKPDGTGFLKMLDFESVTTGGTPFGSLITDGSFFYGMTAAGGANTFGTIFKIQSDGTGFSKILDLTDTTGGWPNGSLFSDGTFLYALGSYGGVVGGHGTLFKIKPDGTGYQQLMEFDGPNTGSYPLGTVISDGTFLYGMTAWEGLYGVGTIFKIKPDGTEYTKLLDFNDTTLGEFPYASLVSDGTFLYGTILRTGSEGNEDGSIFKIKPDGTDFSKVFNFHSPKTIAQAPLNGLVSDGSFLYGTTLSGGSSGSLGTVFKVKQDGTAFQQLLDFNGYVNGEYPAGTLISDGSYLYGTTMSGGINYAGVVFKIKPDGTGYSKLYDFDFATSGIGPQGSLFYDGTFLYGTTPNGGPNGGGTIFKIRPDGTGYSQMINFDGTTTGSGPNGSLISDGTYLYGMTTMGGSISGGTIFKVKPDGTGYTTLFDFNNYLTTGTNPTGNLFYDGTFLYGSVPYGGLHNDGNLFKIKPDGTGYTRLIDFDKTITGHFPGNLISDGTFLYSTISREDDPSFNSIFRIRTDGTEYSVMYKDDPALGNLLITSFISGNSLYGTTGGGGVRNAGTVFKLDLSVFSPNCIANYTTAFDSTLNLFTIAPDSATKAVTTAYHWDFGDGTVSTDSIPTHIYPRGGTYNVSMKVYSSTGDSCIYCNLITGTGFFTINDTVSPPVCIASYTAHYDSTLNSYTLKVDSATMAVATSYHWNFGDGTTSDLAIPKHTYPAAGAYNVCMKVFTSTGDSCTYCMELTGSTTFGINDTVVIPPPCIANYTASYDSTLNKYTVNADSATFANAASYFWTFGDGSNSFLAVPTHTYTAAGSYNVCIRVTDMSGESCSYCRLLTADAGTVINGPDSIPCFASYYTDYDATSDNFSVVVDPASVEAASAYTWDFGDGTTSSLAVPTHTYSAAGSYNVCMKVFTAVGDSCSYCQLFTGDAGFTINTPDTTVTPTCIAGYTYSYDGILDKLTITVDSVSIALATAYRWTFGDGGSSTASIPAHTYTTAGAKEICMKIYTAAGDSCSYCILMTVDSGFTINNPDTLVVPLCIAHYTDTYDGVEDNYLLTVDTTTTALATAYHWDFGDGSSSSLPVPVHTFATAGTYNVCLKIHTETGDSCSYCQLFTGDAGFTINTPDTVVIPPCIANYTTAYDSISNTFTILVDSATTALAVSYNWNFGDGSTSTLATPTHIYTVDSLYNVCMKVFYADGDSCTHCHTIGIDSAGNIIRDGGFSLVVHNATTGVSENDHNGISITIYPNPTTGIFQLAIDNGQLKSNAQLSIYNLVGEKIYFKNSKQLNNSTTIDLSDQPNGIYFMQLKTENSTITKKIIISK